MRRIRLGARLSLFLAAAFLLIVLLFLGLFLPYRRGEVERFLADRRAFLDLLVEARAGEVVHWWVQGSPDTHWLEFPRAFGASPDLTASLYYRGTDGTERLAATTDPALIRTVRAGLAARGVRLNPFMTPAGVPRRACVVAVGGEVWVRTPAGRVLRAVGVPPAVLPPLPAAAAAVGPAPVVTVVDRGSRRALRYVALVALGRLGRETFRRVGHLVLHFDLARLDQAEAALRRLFYGLVAALLLGLLGLLHVLLTRTVVRPLRALAAAMERAGAGDLGVRLPVGGRDEIGAVAAGFNRMVADLARSRAAIQDYSRTLESRVAARTRELEASEAQARALRDHLSAVLAHVRAGVLAVDRGGRVVTCNRRAAELLERDEAAIRGQPLAAVLQHPGWGQLAARLAGGGALAEAEVQVGPPGRHRTFRVAVTPLSGGGKVVVLDDVTDLIYSKRLLAWREAAEKIIHDVKNPLTPIRLSAEQIRVAARDGAPDLDRILTRATENLLQGVARLEALLADLSQLYRRPRLQAAPVDLNALVGRVVGEAQGALPPRVRLRGVFAPELPSVTGDALALWRALTNLVRNAVEAMSGRTGEVRVRTAAVGGEVEVAVEDEGVGIPPERLDQLFEPYFTTKAKGTGLGLVIARQIVTEHGGRITVTSVPARGTRVTVRLPARSPSP